MPKLKTLAPAKINLSFDILGVLPDGYHEVKTILQSIDLADTLTFEIEEAKQTIIDISIAENPLVKQFPLGSDNLIAKAASAFATASKRNFKLNVEVEKVIPIGAGLAGGSTDSAATLVALNEVFGKPLSDSELHSIASSLGADVPFCLNGGTALGTSRGDVLAPARSSILFNFCVVKPIQISVSTPWAYGKYDAFSQTMRRPNSEEALEGLMTGDIELAINSFGNVFEPVIFAEHPSLGEVKESLLKLGAWHVQLSGSGPALFAIVADIEHAHFIRRKILKTDDSGFTYGSAFAVNEFGPPLEFHICQSTSHGIQIQQANPSA